MECRLLHDLLTGERSVSVDSATAKRGELRKRKIGRGTVENARAALRGCLSHAVEEGKIPANPAVRLGRFLGGQDEPEVRKVDFLTETTPKSRKERRVDLSTGLVEVLKRELVKAREAALAKGRAEPEEWVFPIPAVGASTGGTLQVSGVGTAPREGGATPDSDSRSAAHVRVAPHP